MSTFNNLKSVLESGEFAVTAELGPPKSASVKAINKKAKLLADVADAVNITDNQTAVVRMSSIAASVLSAEQGLEPVMQMTCRDRNRIAIQSDIIGAAAMGIKNVLCLSGDHQSFGNQPHSKNVFDIDSIQLIEALKNMRDEKRLMDSDEKMKRGMDLFIGAAANPFGQPLAFRPYRLKKKVAAGADFIQTQCIFDVDIFKQWMTKVREMGLHKKCYILAGVIPLKSARMTEHMAKDVPGVTMPQKFVTRMQQAEDGPTEGIRICVELIEQLKEIEGVAGVHIMAIEWEKKVSEIVKKAGLYPRPKFKQTKEADPLPNGSKPEEASKTKKPAKKAVVPK